VAVNRILSGRPRLKYYEAGMDLGMSYDRVESFRLFQARILEEYDKMVDTDNFVVLDGTLPVNKLQKQMRDIVASKIDLKRFAPRVQESSDHAGTGKGENTCSGTSHGNAGGCGENGAGSRRSFVPIFFWRGTGRIRSKRNYRQPGRY